MKATAVLFDEVGGPEVLRLADVELREPGPGEVRVRIDAIGLNRAEVLFRAGTYYYDAALPASRLGVEAAGAVEAVGPDVDQFAPGDAVNTVIGPADRGMSQHGVYGDRAIIAADRLMRRPDGIDAVTGAAAWGAGFTAYGGLVEVGRMRPGDVVLITAASSSIGTAAIRAANHVGAVPIAVTRSHAKADRLLALGAAHVLVGEDGDVAKRAHALTDHRGVQVVFDCVGGPGLSELAHALAPDGMLIVYGWLDQHPMPMPMHWPVNVYGYATFHVFADPDRTRRATAFVRNGLRTGALAPVIDRTFDLTEIADAHRHMESGDQVGKIVVTVQH